MSEWKQRVLAIFVSKRDDYRKTFSGNAGERVLADLLRKSGWHADNPPTSDIEMAYQEGRRSMMLHIITQMSLTDDRIALLIDNMKEDKQPHG